VKTPLEVEIKLAAASARKARSVLCGHGFEVIRPRVFESNVVLDDARRSLRARGLLLRVRRAGKIFTCTYKGLEMSGPHKRREEREFAVSDFDVCLAVFGALGYRESFRYEKYRTEFARPGESGHATLDETPIGVYIELEGPARWIDRTAREIRYPRETWITASYAALYAEWCETQGIKPSNMTFR
jgi:adenylate cyclase class 2